MSRHWCCPKLPVFSGAIAMVVLCAVGASEAQASCGDWLDTHFRAPALPLAEQTQSESTPLVPCSGPTCGQSPRQVLPPLPAPISIEKQERQCIIIDGADNCLASSRLQPPSEELAPPEVMRDRIDRPPRA